MKASVQEAADSAAKVEAPLFRSVQSTAHRLGCSVSKVWALLRQGRLESVTLDGRRMVIEASLDEFVAALPRRTAPSQAEAR